MMRRLLLLLLSLPGFALAQQATPLTVAITFDDLPYAAVPADDAATLTQMTERLLQQLQAERVPAVGFVNEARLYRENQLDPARVDLLHRWLAAGFELGNHTYSHPSVNKVALETYEADVLQGERVTRGLMQDAGRPLRWFRHPFLHQGKTADTQEALGAFLSAHGYRVAPVTINNAEWVFAAAYARARAQKDDDAAARIAQSYVSYMDVAFARVERLTLDLFGRPIPHVLVLHANALNADHFAALADTLKRRGYRFASLEEALHDRAYARPTGTSGFDGESWLECWARSAGLRPALAPPVPGFVTQWAGPDALRGY